jgi:hypothetical protein
MYDYCYSRSLLYTIDTAIAIAHALLPYPAIWSTLVVIVVVVAGGLAAQNPAVWGIAGCGWRFK